jgi:hypothetical protein
MRDALVLLYCGAVGFVSAGITASLYRWMTSEPARFAPFGRSMPAWVMSFLFFALTGPVLVVEHTIRARIERRIAGDLGRSRHGRRGALELLLGGSRP